jgi:hypothetical protein
MRSVKMRSVKLSSVNRALLGSAAGIFAVTSGQAADLPVKARPIEYVKVCSIYGAGFWYVPGTDTCIKLGTYARIDFTYGNGGSGIPIGTPNGLLSDNAVANTANTVSGRDDRSQTNEFGEHSAAGFSVDVRTQTEYGTLRSFTDMAGNQISVANGGGTAPVAGSVVSFDRAFLQFAGFTAGRIRSFFDVVAPGPFGLASNRVSGDTAGLGILGMGYTVPLSGGFSFSVSAEDPGFAQGGRSKQVVDLSMLANAAGTPGFNNLGISGNLGGYGPFSLGSMTTDNKSMQWPDFTGALRIDQQWGFAQVAGAVHDNSAGYYTNPSIIPCSGGAVMSSNGCGTGPNNENGGFASAQTNGHPSDQLGWAAIAGFTVVNAFGLPGDTLAAEGVYSSGASGYATKANGAWLIYGPGTSPTGNGKVGMGWVADGVFASPVHCNATVNGAVNPGVQPGCTESAGSGVENTNVWSTYGVYEHLWTPKWRTSLYGGFVGVDYGSTAKSLICNNGASNIGAGAAPVVIPLGTDHPPVAALVTATNKTGLISGAAGNGQTIPLGWGAYNNAGGQGIIKSTSGVPGTNILPNTGVNTPTGQSPGVANESSSAATPAGPVFTQIQGTNTIINCDPNFSWAQVGTRTLWNPVPDVDVGIEFSWVHLNTAFSGSLATIGQSSTRPGALYSFVNQDVFSVMFRFQRSFLY